MKMSAGNRIAIVAIVAIAIPSAAFGQARGRSQSASQVPRYTPHSPTVSPYVNLLNRNGGGAALNYYGLVRPLERQQSFNQNQSQQLANQGQLIGNQEQQINRIQDQQEAFSQPKVKATGTAGWFQNMGQKPPFQAADHYYGQWQGTKKARHGH
jgi:hypothetical protein